jgi:hypothetical protein
MVLESLLLKAFRPRVENVDDHGCHPVNHSCNGRVSMNPKRLILNVIGLSLTISLQLLASPLKQVKPQVATITQNPDRPALTEDQGRLLVKEIASVNIGETLAKWSFQEPELVKLRQWSKLLTEQPDRADFLSEWTELISKVKARNASLQGTDVAHLIQMLMSAAYEEAHKDLDSSQEKTRFYKEMERQIGENVATAERLKVLLRPQLNDSSASTLIRLPSYQRALRKCEERAGSTPRLECHEILIATTMELDDYMAVSAKQIQEAKANGQKAELELQKRQQRRLQMLEALTGTSRLMYDSACQSIH